MGIIMNQEKLDRINELARKSKAEGLTESEKKNRQIFEENTLNPSAAILEAS